MVKLFLKAKHWQIFLAFFGLPFIMNIVMTYQMALEFQNGEPANAIVKAMSYILPVIGISVFTLLGWIWSMAIGLQSKVPANLSMKVKKFKFFFFFPLIYISLFLVVFALIMGGVFDGASQNIDDSWIIMYMLIVLPVHLFSMFCMLYTIYFVAKTIRTIEIQMPAKFSEFVGEFFLLWFFPIGVWIIQPRVNKIVGSSELSVVSNEVN